jgi:hypothetical protein
MDATYSQAYSAIPPRVLGVQLLPLSLGHALLLESIASPLMRGADAGAGDLARAVWICSRPASELRGRPLDSRTVEKAWRRWVRAAGECDVVQEMAVFVEYYAAFCRAPERWEVADGKPVKAAWPYAIAVAIRPLFASMDEAFDQPVGHACCLKAAMDALAGDTSLMDETERTMRDSLENDHGG